MVIYLNAFISGSNQTFNALSIFLAHAEKKPAFLFLDIHIVTNVNISPSEMFLQLSAQIKRT